VAGALVGVLIILVCASAVAVFTLNAGHRRAVLVMARAVDAGTPIRPGDLAETRVASDAGVHVLAAADRARVVGRVAAINLLPGMLVSLDLVSTESLVASGHAVVGLALKPGQLPSRLRPLDQVMLVRTTTGSGGAGSADGATTSAPPAAAPILVAQAQIFDVATAADGQTSVVSVVVTTNQAPLVALASARGEISVVLLGESGG
jgi:hypothetical protein